MVAVAVVATVAAVVAIVVAVALMTVPMVVFCRFAAPLSTFLSLFITPSYCHFT